MPETLLSQTVCVSAVVARQTHCYHNHKLTHHWLSRKPDVIPSDWYSVTAMVCCRH